MQRISPPPQELDDLHNTNLWGRLKEDWPTFHKKYIKIWQRRYDYLPTRKPFRTPKLVTPLDYIDWFRHNDKSYLLLVLEKSRQYHCKRPRQELINPRSGQNVAGGTTSAPALQEDPITMQPSEEMYDRPLGSRRSQAWRKEMKMAINPNMHIKMMMKSMRSRQPK
ncbi:hypothetical protein J1N35_011548 [Gossypium stocksii]|uniref:Uncharacterized protein n=1 Tax=Gossypium stocksii TaxID=47602 RepID=A0A9D3W485_9ROSI|nr:hypothetical protein J1N35_011548 [Gossypium stocksii]